MVYRAGLIGVDRIGMRDDPCYAQSFAKTDGIELRAIADVNDRLLDELGGRWDIPRSSRYIGHAAMLESEDLDIVAINTPVGFHHEHVTDAATSSARPSVIWCEKPLATNVRDGEHMVAVCEENGVELVINHQLRFAPAFKNLRSVVENGDYLGDIDSITGQFRGPLLHESTHQIDMLLYLLGTQPEQVSGYLREDEASVSDGNRQRMDDRPGSAMIRMDDDCIVSLDEASKTGYAFNFVGDRGELNIPMWQLPRRGHRYLRTEGDIHSPVEHRELSALATNHDFNGFITEALDNVVEHLVDLADGKATNRSPGRDAATTLETIIAIFISHYTGSRVSIPLDQPLKDVTIVR